MKQELILFSKEDCDWLLTKAGEYEQSGVAYAPTKEDALTRKGKINEKDRISYQCDMGQPTGELYDLLVDRLKPFDIAHLENSFIGFVRYFKGGFFTKHVDGPERAATVIIQLSESDDYTGGNLVVRDKIVGREKGNTVIFDTQTTHELTEVFSGTRDALVIWVDRNSIQKKRTIL